MATWVFKDKLNENLQIPLLNFGQDMVQILTHCHIMKPIVLYVICISLSPIMFAFMKKQGSLRLTESFMAIS